MEQFIFFDEAAQAGVPLPLMALNTVGPTIMRFGTRRAEGVLPAEDPRRRDRLRDRLQRARRGHRPRRAEDRAAVTRRRPATTWSTARRSGPPTATPPTGSGSPSAPTRTPRRTRASPCSSCRPPTPATPAPSSHTLASHDTTASYYENIRVPVARRVGEENKGWRLITNQLNHERVTLAAHGTMAIRALHDVQRWADGDQARRRPPRHRPAAGSAAAWPRPTPGSTR